MPRGGSRTGAGRPATLDAFEMLWVAAEFNSRLQLEREARRPPVIPQEFRELSDRVRSISNEDRRDFARKRSYESQDYFDDLQAELESRANELGVPTRAARYFAQPRALRPYGVRQRLFVEVAAAATDALGKTVTPRRVRECVAILSEKNDDV